jgi:hypothetical protein
MGVGWCGEYLGIENVIITPEETSPSHFAALFSM